MNALTRPLGFEQRESMSVLVVVRWVLLGALLIAVDYQPVEDTRGFALVGSLIVIALALNLVLQWRLVSHREIQLWFPLGIGAYDVAAITAGIAVIDGFDNSLYVLYYPALMAFAALFPGRIALTYGAVIIGAYALLSVTIYQRFETASATDWRELGVRVTTMAAVALLSYLLVRVERQRRVRAVDAEAERQQEVQALQQRTLELERAADDERRRLLREVHDGVSQGVYMLSLGLEGAVHDADTAGSAASRERLEALVRLSKQTLLESRGLLFDLSGVMRGESQLDELVRHQGDEFRAVTGIATTVSVQGESRQLPAATVAEVYRVVQETLANVYRHSAATAVTIELRQDEGMLLRIADDGHGFVVDDARGRGHGLRSMEERAALVGGSVCVVSSPGGGTTVTVTIPAEEADSATHARHAG